VADDTTLESFDIEVGFVFKGSAEIKRTVDETKRVRSSVENLAGAYDRLGSDAKKGTKRAEDSLRELAKITERISQLRIAEAKEATAQERARTTAAKAAVDAEREKARAVEATQGGLTARTKSEQSGLTKRTGINAAARTRVEELRAGVEEVKAATEKFIKEMDNSIRAEESSAKRAQTEAYDRRTKTQRKNQKDRKELVLAQLERGDRRDANDMALQLEKEAAQARRHQEKLTIIAEQGILQRERLQEAADARDARRQAQANDLADKAATRAQRTSLAAQRDKQVKLRDATARLKIDQADEASKRRLDASRLAAESRLEVVRTQQATTAARARNRLLVGLQQGLFNQLSVITRFGTNTISNLMRSGTNLVTTTFGAGVRTITKTWDSVLAGLRGGTDSTFRSQERAAEGHAGRMRALLQRASPAAILGAVGGGAVGRSAFQAFSQYEQVTLSLNRMIGDPEKTKNLLGDIKQFALNTPFEIGDLEQLARGFLLIEKDTNKLVPTLSLISDAVAFTGGTGPQLDRVRLALTQIKSAGRLQGDELNQLAESLPGLNVREIVAKQLGISTEELVKRQEAGKLDADTFIPAFLESLKGVQGLTGTASASVDTLTGKLGNLKDAFTINAREIVGVLSPALKVGISLLTNLLNRSLSFVKDAVVNAGSLFKLYRFRITEQFELLAADPAIRAAIDSVRFGLAAIRAVFNQENSQAQRSLIVRIWEAIPKIFEKITPLAQRVAPWIERAGMALTNTAAEVNQRGLGAIRDRLAEIAKFVAPGAGIVTGLALLRGSMSALSRGNLFGGALLAGAAGFVTLYRTNADFREGVSATIERVKELGGTFVSAFQGKKISGGGFFDDLAAGAGRFVSSSLAAVSTVKRGLANLFSGRVGIDDYVARIRSSLSSGIDSLLAPIRKRFEGIFDNLDPVAVLDGIRKLLVPVGEALGRFLGSKEFLGVVGAVTAAAGAAAVGFVQGFAQGIARSDLGGAIIKAARAALAALPGLLANAFGEAFSNGPFVALAALFVGGLGIGTLVSKVTDGVAVVKSKFQALYGAINSVGTGIAAKVGSIGTAFEKMALKVESAAYRRGSDGLLNLAVGVEAVAKKTGSLANFVKDNFAKIVTIFTTASIAFGTLFSDATPQEKILALIPVILSLVPVLVEIQAAASITSASLAAAFAPVAIAIGAAALISWLTRSKEAVDETSDRVKRLGDLQKATRDGFNSSIDAGGGLGKVKTDFYDAFQAKVRAGNEELVLLTGQTKRYGFTAIETAKAIVGSGRQYGELTAPIKDYRDAVSGALSAADDFRTALRRTSSGGGNVTYDDALQKFVTRLEAVQGRVPGAKRAIADLRDALANGTSIGLGGKFPELEAVLDRISPKLREQLGLTEETLGGIRAQRDAYEEAKKSISLSVEAAQARATAEAAVKDQVERISDSYNNQKQSIMEIKDLLTGGSKNPLSNFAEAQRELVTSADSASSQIKDILANGGKVGDLLSNQFSVAGAKFNDLLAGLGDSAATALTAAASTFGNDPAAFVQVANSIRTNFVAALKQGGVTEADANAVADSVFTPLLDTLANNGPFQAAAIAARTKISDYFRLNPIGLNINLDVLDDIDEADIAIEEWLKEPSNPKAIQSFLSIDGAAKILEDFLANPNEVDLIAKLQDLAVAESQLGAFVAPRTIEIGVDTSKADKLIGSSILGQWFGLGGGTKKAGAAGPTISRDLQDELNQIPSYARDAATKASTELGKLPGAVERATGPGMKRWADGVKGKLEETDRAFEAAPTRAEAQLKLMDKKLRPSTDSIRAQFDGITDSINRVVTATGGTPIVTATPGARDPKSRIPIFHSGGIVGQGPQAEVSKLANNERIVLTQLDEGIIPTSTMAKLSRSEFEWIRTGQLDRLVAARARIPDERALLAGITLPAADGFSGQVAEVMASGLARMVERATSWMDTAAKLITGRLQRETGGYDPTAKVGGNAQAAAWISTAMAIAGVPASWFVGLMTIARRESNFNPRAINLWDSNAAKGIPSKGLMQTIEPTFRRWALPGHQDIWNPVDNAIASIRYIQARYGDISRVQQANPSKPPKGYAYGDIVNRPTLGVFAEAGPEVILPLSKPKRFMELLSKALHYMRVPGFADGALFTRGEPPLDLEAKVFDLQAEREARRPSQVVDARQLHQHNHVHTNVVDPRSAMPYFDSVNEVQARRFFS
jgi:tape measure domain-containing protein